MKNLPSVLPFSEHFLLREVAIERVREREKERVGERGKKENWGERKMRDSY